MIADQYDPKNGGPAFRDATESHSVFHRYRTDSADKVYRDGFGLHHTSLRGLESKGFRATTQVKKGELGNLNRSYIHYNEYCLLPSTKILLAITITRRYPCKCDTAMRSDWFDHRAFSEEHFG
jgi:hypothetical protein